MAILLTANRGNSSTLSLDFIGFRHGRNFAIYVEVSDYQDLDGTEFGEGADLMCEAQRLDGDNAGWWQELANDRIPPYLERTIHYFRVLWARRLEPGRWRMVLRINGREVASREVEISGAHQ